MSGPEITTRSGRVRGTADAGVNVFLGIPFAKPPIGALRLAAPVPAEPWDGVRPADAFGPPPPQVGVAQGDPEWLTVNVWTPDLGAARLPVMVWIYGGAYVRGHTADPTYDGARLAREGGVVVVTLNYRVGAEGFGLFAGAPANRGLLDQVAALAWVHDNIAAFGGAPDQVTVFGESAGGGSVAALLAMPRAAGLFRRAIVQSMPGKFYARDLAEDLGRAMAAATGAAPNAAAIAGLSPADLVAATTRVEEQIRQDPVRWGAEANRPVSPVVDGDVIPRSPWEALAAGQGHDVTLLGGHTRNEWRTMMAMAGQLPEVGDTVIDAGLKALTPDGGEAYRRAFPEAPLWQLYEMLMTDWSFRIPLLQLLDAQVAGGGNAFAYELAWTVPGLGGMLGAPHGSDVPLVFGNLTKGLATLFLDGNVAEAERLSTRMRRAWTSFAATGDPGWDPYNTTQRITKVFDTEDTTGPYPGEAHRLLWADRPYQPVRLPRM
ncbi:carboxylesterase/lipase family protein [Nonomuraea jiangxiensis]|uniref:Carboxylic ester hydrolase n=1 Tax=Nonomuraea jiangxiensis TaxID=633440 RepID=A0A1G7ZG94_9ACTN|nr:carboxylesterase family protein [Nonomuraea jiangxiensis]SDH07110.1 para-nitrobenzyl esterase [Nonomuraea jiangxiensis]